MSILTFQVQIRNIEIPELDNENLSDEEADAILEERGQELSDNIVTLLEEGFPGTHISCDISDFY